MIRPDGALGRREYAEEDMSQDVQMGQSYASRRFMIGQTCLRILLKLRNEAPMTVDDLWGSSNISLHLMGKAGEYPG